MISKGIIERLFEAASIQRWNDYVRPVELTELDKQSHKMIIAYFLAKFEEQEGVKKIDWFGLIEGGIAEFLHRVILTDIKPTVFHHMMDKKRKELNQWVLRLLEKDLDSIGGDFKKRFRDYFFDPDCHAAEKKILKAAHYLATQWEFRIIYHASPFIYGIEETKREIESQIKEHSDLRGVQKISRSKTHYGFIDLCGQLRFQQRWAQSPRLPKTSVLGHMLTVAILFYLTACGNSFCARRRYNNFYAGLFHDLPEVLTRDIVSPVKGSIEGLQGIIKEYERLQMAERVFPLLPVTWHEEIRYFVEDEFANKVKLKGKIKKVDETEQINAQYNQDSYEPLDGKILKMFDHLAAFIEASLSFKYGIKSPQLEEGRKKLYSEYKNKVASEIQIGQLFDYFHEA